ncbi:MAG: hypothetical protein ACKO7N_08780, partial [Candidatus Nitrosotenuis sp.]
RGSSSMILAYAGGDIVNTGVIDVSPDNNDYSSIRQIGPIIETTPSSGIFEFDLPIMYTDGPASSTCPNSILWSSLTNLGLTSTDVLSRFDSAPQTGNYCILDGDIITVEYTDPTDASGNLNTVTDSAIFDLTNGVLESYLTVGTEGTITLHDRDLDLDSKTPDHYNSRVVGLYTQYGNFLTNGTEFIETGDSTGDFVSTVTIPQFIKGNRLYTGFTFALKYFDWGYNQNNYVGQNVQVTTLNSELNRGLSDVNFNYQFFPASFDIVDKNGDFYKGSDNQISFLDNSQNIKKSWILPDNLQNPTDLQADSKTSVYFIGHTPVTGKSYLMRLNSTSDEFTKFDSLHPSEITMDESDNIVLKYDEKIGLLLTQTGVLKEWNLSCDGITVNSGYIVCKESNKIYQLNTITNQLSEWNLPVETRLGSIGTDSSGNIFFGLYDGLYKIGKISTADNVLSLWSIPNYTTDVQNLLVDTEGNVQFSSYKENFGFKITYSGGFFKLIPAENKFIKLDTIGCQKLFLDDQQNIYCSQKNDSIKIQN